MDNYLKRQVYDCLLKWKNHSDHSTLEVSGARQVGKTYIVNKFADEQYRHKIYVNLLEFSGEIFIEHYSKTIQTVLEHNKADFILFAKGNTHGGIADNVYTIPIYGIGKFLF